MDTKIQWALYARKSTESEDRQVQSIDDQVAYFTDVARRENLHIAEIITEAKSAKAPDVRPEFNRLVSLVEKGKIQGILCWKIDRLARNPVDGGRIQWLLQKGIIKCIKASDRDHWPDDNALLFAVEQGMANQYVRDLSKNVKRGLYSKADKGWFPGIPPIGYLNTKWREKGNEEIIIDPERFMLVRKMWDFMLTGSYSPMEILRIASTEWKLDTPKRRQDGKKPMAVSYVYKLFSNIFYTGHFHYAGKLYEGKHQPMITLDEFDKVQIFLGNKTPPRPIVHDFPYTGIMRCAGCGAAITASEKRKLVKSTGELKNYTYYHCTRRMGIDDCKAPSVSLKELEDQLETILRENTIGSVFYDLGMQVLASGKGQLNNGREAIYAKQQAYVSELQKKVDRLLSFLLNETIREEEYTKQKKGLEEQITIETAKLGQMDSRLANYDRQIQNAFHFCRAALHALQNGDTQTRRDLLKHLGSNQRINEKKLCVAVFGWFSVIKSGEEKIMAEMERFEPKESNNDKVKALLNHFSPLMCGLVEQVRTEFAKIPNPEVPDLSSWAINSDNKTVPPE